ncbi:hypothetical protein J45TS6_39300 [Paenibacillus sp. J45TS6]|uniref:DUF3139 domain-containing protein n=1 Tax=Paenibacillus sp. J45TS6 TaxID=2807196 RepID=UPI001B006BC0|nr:DUF3139 domain-containing protein [Paenibacillus sp. J45TS6]GIP45471.1 hypothetical protein J45TS6_39300 [Paenibacillus sp. J45TS6]
MLTKKSVLRIISCIILIGIIGIFLFIFVTLYLINNGNPYHKYLVNKYIPAHLEQLGYTDEDIVDQHMIAPKHGVNHSVYHEHYMVIFKDEPQSEYLYGLTKKGKNVVQFCEKRKRNYYEEDTIEKTNHSESKCMGYLDNRN